MSSPKRLAILARALALAALVVVPARAGAVTAAPGFATYSITTPGTVQGDVVRAGNAIFVGQGTFGVGTEDIIRLDGGVATTVATGFNSLGGFAFANGTLYAVDNNGNGMGALTGDTVFAIPDALTRATALPALGAEVVPAGSIPSAADVAVAGKDLFVSDAAGPGAGRVVRIRGGKPTDLITTGLDYTAGVTVDGARLLVGNSDASAVGSVSAYSLAGVLVGPVASGLSGSYGHDLDTAGNVLVTGGFRGDFSSSTLVAVAPGGGVSERAWGFVFSTGLDHDAARDETLVLDVGVSRIDVVCRDGGGGTCVADVACVGGPALENAKLKLTKQSTPPGDDGLKLVGQMTVPTTPTLDPIANGARVAVSGTGGTVTNVVVPAGAFDSATGTGWKVNDAGTVWKYSNPSGHAGIVKVVVKTVPATPGLVKIAVVGAHGFFGTTEAALPLSATFVLDPDGQCGQVTFDACALNARGTVVKCE